MKNSVLKPNSQGNKITDTEIKKGPNNIILEGPNDIILEGPLI